MKHLICNIANILDADVQMVFNAEVSNKDSIIEARLYSEPTNEQIRICNKFGFCIRKTILNIPVNTYRFAQAPVWSIQHDNLEDIEFANPTTFLYAIASGFYTYNEKTWGSIIDCLCTCLEHKNDKETKRLIDQMCCKDLAIHEGELMPMVEKYVNFINEANK